MNWVLLALGSTTTFAVISALDKILIHRFVPNSWTFITMVGLTQFVIAVVVLPWVTWSGYTNVDAAIGLASGLSSGAYLALMFWVMGSQDVSRVIPVTSTYPIFVAVLAGWLLGEYIGPLAWAGVLVTVGGAALMSLGPTARPEQRGRDQAFAFFLLIVASMGFGLGQFLSKVVAEDMDVWTLMFWRALGNGIVCSSFVVRRRGIGDLLSATRRPIAPALVLFTEGALVFVALLFLLGAIYSGPVSLVSTVMATRPLFVFGLGVLLSVGMANVLDEPLTIRIVGAKLVAIAMTVGGVIMVALA